MPLESRLMQNYGTALLCKRCSVLNAVSIQLRQHPCASMHMASAAIIRCVSAMYLVPDGNPLNPLPAGVLRNEAHAPGRCAPLCSTCRHVCAAALAAPIPYPRHVAILEGHLRRRVKHHPSACQAASASRLATLQLAHTLHQGPCIRLSLILSHSSSPDLCLTHCRHP